MDAELDPTERRLVGVLIEKQLATPDAYPLSVNALVVGANQKSCRDPVLSLFEWQVEGALASLLEKKWACFVDGGRVRRWKHRLDDRLQLTPTRLAVMAELLLRGPQQPGELRRNAERLARIPTDADLQAVLDDLAGRTPPLVRCLGRLPRERDVRWTQMLAPDTLEQAGAGSAAAPPPTAVAAASTAPPPTAGSVTAFSAAVTAPAPAAAAPAVAATAAAAPGFDPADVLARLAALEAEVARLKAALGV